MNDERIDELRQRLRALGYLDAGVDRFVLAPARDTRGPLGVAVRTSLRVGVLGGLLLGPAAALGVRARLPGLVSGARDAFVVAIYLGVLFFVGVTIFTLVMSLLASHAMRAPYERFMLQARRFSAAAGWLTTIACLAYLTLWWRNANAGFGWRAPGWTSFALLVAVAISLLIGHAVRIATLGSVASRVRLDMMPPMPSTRWRVLVGGGVMAFSGAAILLVATASPEAMARVDRPALAVIQSHAPIRVLAIDGFDPRTFAKLARELPVLNSLLAGPVIKLMPQDTSDPARAWTTIATGVPPAVHGVHAIENRRVAGLRGAISGDTRFGRLIVAASDLVRLTQPSIVTSQQRQAKTFWEVAEDAGLRTAVVNWWATWPAPSNGGIVITDRAILRLEQGGALDGEIAPPVTYESLRAEWPAIRAAARQAAADAFPGDAKTAAILRRSAELDATVAAISERIWRQPLDLYVVYLPGLDIAQNALIGSAADNRAPSEMAERIEALSAYYPFLDRVISPLARGGARSGNTVIITQPGRIESAVGGRFGVARLPPTGMRGTGLPVIVAPTILAGLGVPFSEEVGVGSPEMFGDLPPNYKYRFVPSYGRPFTPNVPRTGTPLDQETIDRLRSLGYIK